MSFRVIPSREIEAITARAIAEGRHSRTPKFFCVGCGNWVSSIFYTTIDKKRLCPECADRLCGQGPKSMPNAECQMPNGGGGS